LVKEGLADHLQAYEAGLGEERETLAAYINSADKASMDTLKAHKEYTQAYSEVKDQLGRRQLLDRCLWLSERKYLHSATLATAFLKELACFVLRYIKKFVDLENLRLAAIRGAMHQFIAIQEGFFVHVEAAESALGAVDSVGVLTQSSVFATLFQSEELAVLRQFSDKEDIEEALLAWDLVIPASIPLILVRNKVYQEVANSWVKLKGIITADGFFYLFDKFRDSQLVEPILAQQLTLSRLDLELNPQSRLLRLKIRLSRFRNFLKQPTVVLLRLTNERKYESWKAVLTHFLPEYTSVDSAGDM